MKKQKPKKVKKVSPAKKALKSPIKALRKFIKKITRSKKKILSKRRLIVKSAKPKEPLVIKKSFKKISKPLASEPVALELNQAPLEDRRLPAYYSEDKLVLLIRDPWWLFAYWEVTPGRRAHIDHEISSLGLQAEKVTLRVYDVTDSSIEKPISFFDIEIQNLNSNWYVDVGQPNRSWVAEIGVRTLDGRFFALVRSNVVKTPGFGISEVLDEEWMMPAEVYFKLVGMIGGFETIGGSMEMKKIFERYIRQTVSSESCTRLSKALSTQTSKT